MSETAARFCKRKPVISAQVEIAEHFEAMTLEHADLMAMLADADLDFSGRFVTPYFFAEDDPTFEQWFENSRRSTNALFLDMAYDEQAERDRIEDEKLEEAAAIREEHRHSGYDLHY